MWIRTALALVVLMARMSEASVCDQESVGDATYEASCLLALQSDMTNTDRYWFGTSFSDECPDTATWTTTIECYNTLPDELSLGSVTDLTNLATAGIVGALNVTFTSPAGSYVACDYQYTQTYDKTIEVDPLGDETVTPWDVRALPTLEWATTASTQYTVIILDVGYNVIQGMWIDITGNDLTSGTTILAYIPPLNPYDTENPYYFLVYQQTNNNMGGVSAALQATTAITASGRATWVLGDLTGADGLTGPIAVSRVLVEKDPYSVQFISSNSGIINNCVPFVEEKYVDAGYNARPWLPVEPDFDTFISVSFQNALLSLEYCCETTTYPAATVTLDPIGDSEVLAAVARGDNTRSVVASANVLNPNPSVDFSGKQYTLMELAPDLPVGWLDFGNNDLPLAMWITVNNEVSSTGALTGTSLVDYLAAVPPNSQEQFYYFLLYEQSSTLTVADINMAAYTNNTCGLPNRCRLDISQFVADQSLTLVGASWMTVDRDVDNYCNSEDGLAQETVCAGAFPCNGAPRSAVMSALWIVTGVVMSALARLL